MTTNMEEMPKDLKDRYLAAMHGMQSGVATELTWGLDGAATPKHLRVGLNGIMTDHGALVRLLIKNGVFTAQEYYEAIVEGAEMEHRRYENRLGVKLS